MSRTRTITLTLGSLAAGAVLATGVTGLAMAADGTPTTPSTSTSTGAPTAPDAGAGIGGPHGDRGGRGMHGGPMGQALHGEFVVKADDGTITTVREIHGTVTAVSADSITVKSDDDYSATFAITSTTEIRTGLPDFGADPATDTDSISDVKVGDVAHVSGTVSGSTATADRLMAMTADEAAQLEQQRQQHMADRAANAGSTPSGTTQAG